MFLNVALLDVDHYVIFNTILDVDHYATIKVLKENK